MNSIRESATSITLDCNGPSETTTGALLTCKMCKGLLMLLIGGSALFFAGAGPSQAGKGFFEKIGDGWRKGDWIRGLPDVKPKSIAEVILPVCWGRPQECRGDGNAQPRKSSAPRYSVSFRVDCIDARNGRDRGDATVTYSSNESLEAAKQAVIKAYTSSDLCQMDPNYKDLTRVMKLGSGRFLE